MEKNPNEVNSFKFKESGKLILEQEFDGSITIKGYTDKGMYEFTYQEWEE